MRHPAFTFAPNFINNQNKSSMAIKKVSNEFMAKVLNDVAWKALSNTSNEILFHEECWAFYATIYFIVPIIVYNTRLLKICDSYFLVFSLSSSLITIHGFPKCLDKISRIIPILL